MLKFLCCLILLCLLEKSEANPAGQMFVFSGTVGNTPSGYVYLSYIDSTNHRIVDSSKLSNGRFTFTGYISSPVMASFRGATLSESSDSPRYANVFIEPGKMEGSFPQNNFKHSTITGSKTQTEYRKYIVQLDNLDIKWKVVINALRAYKNDIDKDKNFAIYDKGLPLYLDEQMQISRQFIRNYPQSYVSANLMRFQMYKLSHDSLKIYYNRLSPAVRSSTDGALVGNFIFKEEAIAVGKPAPDFMQPDTSGNSVWLHDYKGNYVLLDVWASWCKPCREEHPNLRQAYEKFSKKGFTILSLSLDREEDRAAWLSAIAKDNLTWPQLCDFTFMQNKVVDAYNISGKGIPANFLISPDGTILAMNLRGEEVEKKLAAYIK